MRSNDTVRVISLTFQVGDKQRHEEGEHRRRRQRRDDDDDSVDPEELVELSGGSARVCRPSVKSLMAAASGVIDLSVFLEKRKATLEEQIAAASLSPGCLACWVGEAFTFPR